MTLKELLDITKYQLKDLTTLKKPDFRLEQTEYIKKEGVWDVVVSYLVENTNKRLGVGLLTEFEFHRIYKRVKIDNEGVIVGVYIYNNRE